MSRSRGPVCVEAREHYIKMGLTWGSAVLRWSGRGGEAAPFSLTGCPGVAILPGFSWGVSGHPALGRVMVPATTVKLVISSEVRLVDVVHTASEAIAGIAGFEEDDALNVGIAVREAVINAILHGNRMDPSRKVEVSLQARPRSVSARVRDQGAGFDPVATPDPTVGDNLMRDSGRGILVMRAFVDSVDFKFREGRGMEVTLKKNRVGGKTTSSARPVAAAVDNGGIER